MRKLLLLLLLTAALPAQEGDPLPGLAATAAKAAANWETLAKGLEAKIARMLPCDPRVAASIDEVRLASQTRLAAMNQYLQAAVAQAREDSDVARNALVSEQASARDAETDHAEAEQERIAIDGQLSGLTDSAKSRPALEDARGMLQSIETSVAARAAQLQAQSANRAALVSALKDVSEARLARQRALEAELGVMAIETARFTDYYAARLARARTECDVTNPNRATRRKQ